MHVHHVSSNDPVNLSVNDTPGPPCILETIVLDELRHVKKDIKYSSKSCLVDKMLGDLIDMRTIISRTKENWKFCKGDVDYLKMGNN